MYAHMRSNIKYICYRFKSYLQLFIIIVILVVIIGNAFVLTNQKYSLKYSIDIDNRLSSAKQWLRIPYMANPMFNDHKLFKLTSTYNSYDSEVVVLTEISYLPFPVAPTEEFIGSKYVVKEKEKEKLSNLGDFYSFIKRPQFHCRKLVRMGGEMECKGDARKHSHMDGHKLICMDPQLELRARKNPDECLTLSFGINTDVSFDGAVADFNCEIHMFDPYDWPPPRDIIEDYPNAHYHISALGAEDKFIHTTKNNYTVGYFRLQTHLTENGLFGRPVHILKMDIEFNEWEVLKKDLLNTKLLTTVGQIAMEIHTLDIVYDLKNATSTVKLAALQEKYDILRSLESHGFLPVSYWDNVQDKHAVYDDDGRRFETAGEILYVNTNWYNQNFKQNLVKHGIKFRLS